MNNRFMKSYERMDGTFSATVVVDSLPTENIKPNVIYAVKKIDYYTSFYGLHISPLTSMSDVNTRVLADLMRQNGWKSSEITEALFGGILMMGLLPENLTEISNFKGYFINEYADNLFKLRTYIADAGVDFDKSFEKLDDLYQYLFSEEYAQSAGLFTQNFTNIQTKLREHNFVWSEQALPDYQLGVVFTPVYEYYIYNGEEWITIDYKPIITKKIEWDGDVVSSLEALIFTSSEVDLLKNGAELEIICNIDNQANSTIYAKKTSLVQQINDNKFAGISYDLTLYAGLWIEYYTMIINNEDGKITTIASKSSLVSGGHTTIPVSAWTEGVSGTYKYSASIQDINDVNTQSTVLVMFGKDDAESGNFSPYVDTSDGGFQIYAKEKPTTEISIHVEVFN